MMAPRQSADERRHAVLAAAMTVFARNGFAAATTDEIAREAGLSKGGLYWHFKSKDEILAALLLRFFDQELAHLQALLAADTVVADRLRQLTHKVVGGLLDMERFLPITLEFYALAARNPGVRQVLQGYYARYHERLSALLSQGFARGEFQRGTAAAAAVTIIAAFEGLALLWAITPQLVALREQAEAAMGLILEGLAA